MANQNSLEKSILATIAYFDIFDYPLTLVEIWKWLYQSVNQSTVHGSRFNFLEIQKTLEDNDVVKSLVDTRRGFYFLKSREGILELRQVRYNLAEKKFKKALRVARFLKLMPGIKMIAVCNSLAWSNASEGSDIDLFIVTAKNRIWTTRFWATGFLKLFGLRPGKITQDKICLSFFVDEANINLEPLAISQPDVYLIYWIAQLALIYDAGGVYRKFVQANQWVEKYLPNYFGAEPAERRWIAQAGWPKMGVGVGEKFFRWLQLKVMPPHLKEMANRDTRVIISDTILKFHANDRREEYRGKWLKRISPRLNPLP